MQQKGKAATFSLLSNMGWKTNRYFAYQQLLQTLLDNFHYESAVTLSKVCEMFNYLNRIQMSLKCTTTVHNQFIQSCSTQMQSKLAIFAISATGAFIYVLKDVCQHLCLCSKHNIFKLLKRSSYKKIHWLRYLILFIRKESVINNTILTIVLNELLAHSKITDLPLLSKLKAIPPCLD